jgi:flagellar capping protein FliD
MGNSVNGVESKYSQLALIGISTTGKEHNLVINYDKLKAALRENTKEVEKLFTQDDLNLREVLGRGDGKNKKFISLKNAQIDPKDIQVRVGNKVYSKNGKNKLLLKSELERKKLSKVDMIKYVINGDIRSKADLDIHLGKGVPANAAVIDDVTGAIELGKAPDKNEEIIIESSRNINKSKYGFSEGIANKVNNYLNPFVTYGGTFDRQSKAFDSRINQMNDWIARTDERLTMREDALKRQFAGMEGSMSSSNAQSSWLSGQIAQL